MFRRWRPSVGFRGDSGLGLAEGSRVVPRLVRVPSYIIANRADQNAEKKGNNASPKPPIAPASGSSVMPGPYRSEQSKQREELALPTQLPKNPRCAGGRLFD